MDLFQRNCLPIVLLEINLYNFKLCEGKFKISIHGLWHVCIGDGIVQGMISGSLLKSSVLGLKIKKGCLRIWGTRHRPCKIGSTMSYFEKNPTQEILVPRGRLISAEQC